MGACVAGILESPEKQVLKDHPLRQIQQFVRDVLASLTEAGSAARIEAALQTEPRQKTRELGFAQLTQFANDPDPKLNGIRE